MEYTEKELVNIWLSEHYDEWIAFPNFKRMVLNGSIEISDKKEEKIDE